MRKQPGIERNLPILATIANEALSVLSVSPLEADHLSFQTIADHSLWAVFKAQSLMSALVLLQRHNIGVVLCERDLLPGSYIDLLEHLSALANAPCVIVTSRLADDHLWAEALNLGAWDVLAKPFDRNEVIRTVASAWRNWQGRIGTVQRMAATGT